MPNGLSTLCQYFGLTHRCPDSIKHRKHLSVTGLKTHWICKLSNQAVYLRLRYSDQLIGAMVVQRPWPEVDWAPTWGKKNLPLLTDVVSTIKPHNLIQLCLNNLTPNPKSDTSKTDVSWRLFIWARLTCEAECGPDNQQRACPCYRYSQDPAPRWGAILAPGWYYIHS